MMSVISFPDLSDHSCASLLDGHAVSGAFYMLYREHVVSLLAGVAGHVIEGLTFSEQYFQNVARLELRELNLGLDEGHRAVLLRNV